ncbi:MAG TPA: hypothetical protein VLJ61_07460 [Pyrinomonadaceae bacterium]|nr:hypothetical protein [Pyrinomonadaceae bacterium]
MAVQGENALLQCEIALMQGENALLQSENALMQCVKALLQGEIALLRYKTSHIGRKLLPRGGNRI